MSTIIEVHNLNKSYQKRRSKEKVHAVRDISFQVKTGEIMGLLGPNGAGKSTTIKMICGLIRPDSGKVLVNGIDNTQQRLQALRHISAVLEGNRNLYWRLTVRENLEYFAGNRGRSARGAKAQIDGLLEQFHLQDKAKELVNSLSRGMQQKLAIAVAMLANTQVILLDEPTLGLDVETSYEVRDILRSIAANEQRTVIISSHDMAVVQDICKRTVIINQGQVVVDEQVDNLLELFSTRAYTVSLEQPLSAAQKSALAQHFPVIHVEDDDRTFTVNLEQSEAIYTLMDILKSEQSPITTMERTNIDFEEVFRQIIRPTNDKELEHDAA